MLRGVESRVGPVERHIVRERHVADAEIIVRAQCAERILDGVTAFESEKRADLALLEVAPDVFSAERERQPVRVFRYESAGDVYLLELDSRISGVAVLAGSVHGPELSADHALLQTVEIRVPGRMLAEIVGIDVSARY